jgi:uncharacterized repeat protein (TIGR03803 family)
MRLRFFPRAAIHALTVLAITLIFVSSGSARPKYKVLHAFTGGKDGGGLPGGVTVDKAGNVYGATSGGGTHVFGTVFQLSPSPGGRWTEIILYDFCAVHGKVECMDGAGPGGDLVFDAAGNLYGTAPAGGSSDGGCGL